MKEQSHRIIHAQRSLQWPLSLVARTTLIYKIFIYSIGVAGFLGGALGVNVDNVTPASCLTGGAAVTCKHLLNAANFRGCLRDGMKMQIACIKIAEIQTSAADACQGCPVFHEKVEHLIEGFASEQNEDKERFSECFFDKIGQSYLSFSAI